jgi:hypothetical protein
VDVEHRVVHEREARLALPREVPGELRLPLGSENLELLERRLRLGDRFAFGQSLRGAFEESDELFDGEREVREEVTRLQRQAIREGAQVLFEKLGREDLTRAVRQVVRLVHDEDGLSQTLPGQMPQRDARLEDVVVVRHDRVGPLRELELHLEGTDFLAARLLEDGVGVHMRIGLAQPAEDVRPGHLLRVAPRKAAEVLVAEDPVVRAHPLLRAHLERRERPLVHRDERGNSHLLLQRLGRQEDDLPAAPEPLRESRMQGRGSLSRTGRRFGEEVLPLAHRGRDGVDDLPLNRPRRRVREGEAVRRPGLPVTGLRLRPPDPEQPREPTFDCAGGVVVIRHVDRDLFPRLDVHVNERPRDLRVAEAFPQVAVAFELPAVPLETVAGRADPVDREVRGLELLDQPVPFLPLEAPVEPASQDRRPVLDRDPGLEVDLGPVRGMGVAAKRQDPRMDLGAQAEPPPAVAPVEADAPEPLLLGELADRDLEELRFLVESHEASIIIFGWRTAGCAAAALRSSESLRSS